VRFPAGVAVDYYRDLLKIVRALWEDLRRDWPAIEALLKEAKEQREDVRQDAPPEELDSLLSVLRLRGGKLAEQADAIAAKVDRRISDTTARQLADAIRKALGAATPEVAAESIGISQAVKGGVTSKGKSVLNLIERSFMRQNVALIKSIPEDFHDRVQNIVWQGIRTGSNPRDVRKQLQEAFGVERNRAKLIARDQTNKLFGQLNHVRQEEAGITTFIWWTVGDNRVRDSHEKLHGKVFTWKDGANGLFPGDDINCRCIAEPNPAELRGEPLKEGEKPS